MRAIFLSTEFPFAPWVAEFQRAMPDLELRCWPDIGDPGTIEAALAWLPQAGALAALPNLRLIHVLGAGVDSLLRDPGLRAETPIIRLVDPGMTTAMGEYVEMQVLRLHRQQHLYREQQQDAVWRELAQPNAAERRVGILGLGVMGSEAALRLTVLGFDVEGWSLSGARLRGIPCHRGEDGLARLLARSEILVCLLPLTPATENILDAKLFAALPRGAAIINCARGRHLVEADLLTALATEQLAAAVLDVFAQEPLPPEHPFWRHPRIVVTPHVAAATNPKTAAPIVAAALRRFAAGEKLENLVDRARGY